MGSLHERDFSVDNYEEFYEDHHFSPLKDEHALQAHRYIPRVAWALDVAKEIKPKRVLDLGCLDGFAGLTIANNVPSVKYLAGADLSSDGIEHSLRRARTLDIAYHYYKGTVENFMKQYAGEPFDLVLCFELIEHVKNPGKMLRLIDKVKAKDGTVLVSTPDFEGPTFGKDDEQNKCHIRLYTTAAEDYDAVNKYGNTRHATSITQEIGEERIIELDVINELINVRYQ